MDKIDSLLRDLALKLGTTMEYLWSILTKQQTLDAYQMLVWATFFVLIITIGFFIAYFVAKTQSTVKYGCDICSNHQVVWNIWIGISLFLLMLIISISTSAIKILNNPEYYALQDILRQLGG